ncbi:RNA polymerase sigma factor RpoH [Vibrio chagasii]|nr:RNA polymerase sigma factor RpoH [Vibrio chagasii]
MSFTLTASFDDGFDLDALAKQYPSISREKESELIANAQINKCQNSTKMLIQSHLKLVLSVARKYHTQHFTKNDLVGEGIIGLMKAIKAFDLSSQNRLTTYALPWIRSEIREFVIQNFSSVRIATTKAQRKLFFNAKKLNNANSEQEKEMLAESLSVSREDVDDMKVKFSSMGSMERFAPSDDEASFDIGEDVDFSKSIERNENIRALNRAIPRLNERHRHIIQRRLLTDNPDTLTVLAKEFGISEERVRQVQNDAVNKLKALVAEEL